MVSVLFNSRKAEWELLIDKVNISRYVVILFR